MAARTRLFRELKECQRKSDESDGLVKLYPTETNIYLWSATLRVSKRY